MAGGEAGAAARPGEAPADRPRGLVELDAGGRRRPASLRLAVVVVIALAALAGCATPGPGTFLARAAKRDDMVLIYFAQSDWLL